MSQDQTAFLLRSSVPERKALQDAIDSLRFDCKIYEGYVPFQSSGFLPFVFNGTKSGFEIYFGTAAESIAHVPHVAAHIGNRDIAIRFVWGSRIDELACVTIVCMALAKTFDGVIYYDSGDMFLSTAELAANLGIAMKFLGGPTRQ